MFKGVSRRHLGLSVLSLAVAGALSACGGGGGGKQVIIPNPPPPTGNQPPVVAPVDARYAVAYDVTNTKAAHTAGFTGAGVTIGVVDSGVERNNPALQGRVRANLVYISSRNDLTVDDKVGHGTAVSLSMAGRPWGAWPGGVATNSNIVSARIIQDARPEDDGSGQGNEVDGALGLAPIHDDLIARGVRIMNNSWGGLYWTNLNATKPISDEYRKFIFNNDGLVVFATGNEGRANPTDMSSMPSKDGPGGTKPAADLERGWLAVAALSAKSGETFLTAAEVMANPQLAPYSNACGFAMNYCLVAPGDVVVPGKNDPYNAPTFWRYSGTSLSAPQVSGAAALVWQAFPYFNNDLVRQTVLGTAKDIGAPGVDPVFGYGLLDVGKAVLGPAKLDWGNITVNNPAASRFGNAISGAGGIVKNGAGTLTLAGNNTYTGITQINAGEVSMAHGTGGNLINSAKLTLTGAGPHNVNGNFNQTANGTLSYLVGAPLNVTGTASLAGTLNVAGKVSGYTHKAKETVVSAAGGLSGTFGSMTKSPGVFLEGTLGYDANNAFLNINSLNVTATATTLGFGATALGGAGRVDGSFGGGGVIPGSGFDVGGGAIQRAGTNASAEFSLSSLNGDMLTADLAYARMGMDASQHQLDRRLDALASGSLNAGTWSMQNNGAAAPMAGMGLDSQGWRVGQDVRLASSLIAGASLGESRGSAWSQLRADRFRNRSVDAQLYTLWSPGHGRFVSASVTRGMLDQNGSRQIALGDYGFEVASDHGAQFTRSSLALGQSWSLENGLRVTPYVGTTDLRLSRSAFNEQGALGFGLQGNASSLQARHGVAGLRLGMSSWHAGGRWDAFAFGERQRLLSSSGDVRLASFTGFALDAPINGYQLAPQSSVFGLGLQADYGQRGLWNLRWDSRAEHGQRFSQAAVSYRLGF